ncbi:hypothetical protein BV22DRAFT_1200386 [Leucogyrophana mollusca]|uniref:Uncharacterized protein n=1 Tax=Leucogyrophana mollusca TaxID=85980 RepID=A0ACB8AU96_9AGAM|nr:hypothetical protein BV22DRAFT_1200386 [Leucogyrophana mollusca]
MMTSYELVLRGGVGGRPTNEADVIDVHADDGGGYDLCTSSLSSSSGPAPKREDVYSSSDRFTSPADTANSLQSSYINEAASSTTVTVPHSAPVPRPVSLAYLASRVSPPNPGITASSPSLVHRLLDSFRLLALSLDVGKLM